MIELQENNLYGTLIQYMYFFLNMITMKMVKKTICTIVIYILNKIFGSPRVKIKEKWTINIYYTGKFT